MFTALICFAGTSDLWLGHLHDSTAKYVITNDKSWSALNIKSICSLGDFKQLRDMTDRSDLAGDAEQELCCFEYKASFICGFVDVLPPAGR